ncbi:MAG: DNA topoisomerase (ATP-hydrolyzing) subunit A [Defluviitaleaceae bacterium]|nr:DNA topoisomerase (ATP-hydrolyzing) subunit A [Defluviitaleaceae bacterium]
MARKKIEKITTYNESPPILQGIVETLESNYMPYAMSVIVSRAIPEIDGFKPAHRKLLYTMYKMGLLSGNRSKSADVVGTTMRLNPHGEQAIYETLVRLTRGNEALLHPFVDSKGNFGKVYSRDMAHAASRYTEVRLDNLCGEIFKDIDKGTVQFVDNYNGTMVEPSLLPTTFPNLLVTPNTGIAVGMASSICSFNLAEICNATVSLIKNKDFDPVAEISAPDFSTGGEIIYNREDMAKIYATGRGSFKIQSRWRFDAQNSCIEVYEIPYTTTIEAIIDKMHTLVKSGKMKEITDVRDETDLKGLKIAIDIKKSANPDLLMQKLFAATPLMDSFSCNFNLLVNGRPQTIGITQILTHWIDFRKGCIEGRLKHDLEKNHEKLHLLNGLAAVLLDIDKAIKIIRDTEKEKQVIPNLCIGFGIDAVQAEYIAEIRLRNLNKEYLLRRIQEREGLEKEIAEIIETLGDEKKVLNIIVAEQKQIAKKYGKERKTGIVTQSAETVSLQEFVENYPITLYLTKENYFKKIANVSLRTSPDIAVKESDAIIQQISAQNIDDILFFSDKFNVYKLRAHELEDVRPSQMGQYLNNILPCDSDEKIIFITATSDYSGHLVFAFRNGKVALVTLDSYATKLNRKKQVHAYSDKSPLIFAEHIAKHSDYLAIRNDKKALIFNTAQLPIYSAKNSGGVQVVRLAKNGFMESLAAATNTEGDWEWLRCDKLPAAGQNMDIPPDAQLQL